jgi:hypothetical protein
MFVMLEPFGKGLLGRSTIACKLTLLRPAHGCAVMGKLSRCGDMDMYLSFGFLPRCRAARRTFVAIVVAVACAALSFGEVQARVIYLSPEAYASHLAIKLGVSVFFCTLVVGAIAGSIPDPSIPKNPSYILVGILGAFSAVLYALLSPEQISEIPEALQLYWEPRQGFWAYWYLYIAYAVIGAIIPSFVWRLIRQHLGRTVTQ